MLDRKDIAAAGTATSAAATAGASAAASIAKALWYEAPGRIALHEAPLRRPSDGEALVEMAWSAVSRGTERLVLEGRVPPAEYERMRAPMQEGDFPFPVKYGYCAAGIVGEGPAELVGRGVFLLHPHQSRAVVPAGALRLLPEALPLRRAAIAANMETALNALWDSGAGPGDRIAVVGCGLLGLLVAYLSAQLPGAEVVAIDLDASRENIVRNLGAEFIRAPEAGALRDFDVVFHVSASAPGLASAIGLAGLEARVIELSWYGEGAVAAPLGGAFHSRRLQLVSSQVGQISPGRRPRWDYARRMEKALELLCDDRLDALITHEFTLDEAPRELPLFLRAGSPGLAAVIRYA